MELLTLAANNRNPGCCWCCGFRLQPQPCNTFGVDDGHGHHRCAVADNDYDCRRCCIANDVVVDQMMAFRPEAAVDAMAFWKAKSEKKRKK